MCICKMQHDGVCREANTAQGKDHSSLPLFYLIHTPEQLRIKVTIENLHNEKEKNLEMH